MKLFEKWQTKNSILDSLIASAIWTGLTVIFVVIPSWLLTQGLIATGDKTKDWIISTAVIFFILISISVFLWKIYNIWHWASGRTAKYLKELNTTLKTIHPGIRPLLAYIAKESAAHLIASTPDKKNIGEEVTINEYIRLLEESIHAENLIDVTFFAKAKASLWGDCDNVVSCTDIQRHAWDYFNTQKAIKAKNPSIRMRRYLLVSKEEYDNDDATIKNNFIEKHKEAKIDLLHLPPENISAKKRGLLGDMAIFWTSDLNGWILYSDLKEDEIKLNRANVFLIYDQAALKNRYSDMMKEVLQENRRFVLASDSCNISPIDFLKEINVHL